MYKSLLILFLLPIFMKYNDTSHKLLYKCLAHDVMRSAGLDPGLQPLNFVHWEYLAQSEINNPIFT
jgi:hypothetical protein